MSVRKQGILLLLLSLLILPACQQSADESSSPSLTVRIGSFSEAIDYGPFLVAKSKGWFEEALQEQGATVSYQTFQSLAPINESFGTGRIDIVFEAAPPAIIGHSAGHDIRIIDISSSLNQEIVVHEGSNINSIANLSGQRIGVLKGTSSHYGLLQALQSAAVSSDELEIIDIQARDAKVAFQERQIDAWAIWPPFPEQEIVDGTARTIDGGETLIHSIMAARGAFVEQNPNLAQSVVDVVNRATRWMTNNPEEAQRLIASELNLEPQVVELAWPKHNWNANLGEAVVQDIQAKADFLFSQGLIANSVRARTLIAPLDTVSTTAMVEIETP